MVWNKGGDVGSGLVVDATDMLPSLASLFDNLLRSLVVVMVVVGSDHDVVLAQR